MSLKREAEAYEAKDWRRSRRRRKTTNVLDNIVFKFMPPVNRI